MTNGGYADMIHDYTMQSLVSERQATMLADADHRRLVRRAVSARRAGRRADAQRRRIVSARSASTTPIEISTAAPSSTVAPISSGGLRSFFRLSRA
jgi:hypothetical protein